MASKYLAAAQTYRDQLSASEQTVLDAYLKDMAKNQTDAAVAPAQASSSAVAAGGVTPATASSETTPAESHENSAALKTASPRGATTDSKQEARWKLQTAREQLRLGNYDDASKLVAEVRAMNVRWGLFDDTPSKVAEAIEKARPKTLAAGVAAPTQHDRRTAKAKLKEARTLLASNQFEQAEAIALDVKGWNLYYGLFEDTPDKVTAAARALRRRDDLRKKGTKEGPSQGVYDALVQESRQLLSNGQLDQAESKAKRAQRMNVVPPLTADRAEAVLHDIAMVRAGQIPPAAADSGKGQAAVTASPSEPASVTVERQANELLARGDNPTAAAKFAEAERLKASEMRQTAASLAANTVTASKVDPGVRQAQASGNEALQALPAAEPVPALAAPAAELLPPGAPDAALAQTPPAPNEAPAPLESAPAATAAPGNRGEQQLAEARTLYAQGNYGAARQMATEAKSGGHGVDAQADDVLAQIALAEQGGALSLYESALDAIRKGESGRARALLTEASNAQLDDATMQKVQDLLAKLPAEGAGKASTGLPIAAQDAEVLAAQKLNAEVGTKLAEGRRLQEVDPDKAIAIYESTLQAVKIKASELPEGAAKTMVRRLEVAIELAKKDKVAFDVKMKDENLRAEIENKRLRILEADKAKRDRMKDLMDRATTAMAENNYQEAEKLANMAHEVDPNEVAATILAWKARVQRHYKKDMENKLAKEEGATETFEDVDKSAIMDPAVIANSIAYAKDFKDLTRERLKMNARLEIKKDPKTLEIESKLNDPVSLNMENRPLAEAVSFLANYTGINIVLDPKALSDIDLTTSSPVSLQVSGVKLKSALKLLLRPLGLNYKVEDEVLMITSPQASLTSTYAHTYYVGDLILSPTHKGPLDPLKLRNGELDENNQPTNGADPQQQLQTIPLANGGATVSPNGQWTRSNKPRVDMTPLIQLITATIAPGTWQVVDPNTNSDTSAAYGLGGGLGGGDGGLDTARPIGSITPFFLSISLIIRHTAEIHDQIADLLRQLRRLQDLQVSIEVRFITLSDSFFEQIGVDFDFDILSKTVGKHSTFAVQSQSLFPTTATTGGTSTSTTGGTSTSTTGGTSTGTGTTGTTGGTGGGGGIGTTGGLGGQNAGGLGGLGGGGGSIGGGSTGTTGGTAGSQPVYTVSGARDFSLGNVLPLVVGTSSGAPGSFSNNLAIPFTQGSADLIAPSNATPNAGATFGLAFLSDLEVYLFLTAAQGDTRTNILQAPKVTTFNGAQAFIQNTEQINFVESLTPIVGPGSVAFFPQVTSFPNGVNLSVTPVVSADRRYVRMTLSPVFTVIEGFNTISVPAAVGGSGLGGQSSSINGTIQLPQFNFTTVQTTVTVPDGGTVLLGGVKRLNEERREFGVPVLSKTPLLNRLFRNIGIGRTTSSLMLMVTPRIIILEEEEERLGIPTVAQ